MSELRVHVLGDDAFGRVRIFLGVSFVSGNDPSERRRLLRVLFLWIGGLPIRPGASDGETRGLLHLANRLPHFARAPSS